MNQRNDRAWNAISAVAVLSLVVIVGSDWLVPSPTPQVTQTTKSKKIVALDKEVDIAEAKLAEFNGQRARLTNPGTAESVTASLLNRVTSEADVVGIKLVAFRPQRVETINTLQSLPYLVIVEGAYDDVLRFVRSLEQPQARVAVSSLQISSADGASDRVNGSLGIVAFAEASKEVLDGAKS